MIHDYLVVIDMQNDFITGPLGTKEAVAIVPNVVKKIDEYRSNGKPILFTQDSHCLETYHKMAEGKHLPIAHCIEGTYGWEIISDIKLADNEFKITKPTFASMNLAEEIFMDFSSCTVELIGVCTGICVISNAIMLKTFNPYCEVVVDASCCACITPESHKRALETMKTLQINIINE